MHRLLCRQLKKIGLDPASTPPPTLDQWRELLSHIDRTYEQSDQDRYTLERSLTISSDEMHELYTRLKDSTEARWKAIANALPDLLFLQDEKGIYHEIFSEARDDKLFRPESEIINKHPKDIFPPQVADTFMTLLQKALDTQEIQILEYELDVPAGRRWFEARMTPAKLRLDGEKTVITLARDITDQKQAEIRQRLASTVFEAVTEGMVILDRNHHIIFVNSAFTYITGHSEAEVVDNKPHFLKSGASEEKLRIIWSIVEAKGVWRGELQNRRANGQSYHLWLSINAVKDSKKRITHYALVLSDISELKRSQEELEYIANHDPLTHLPNRALFHEQLEQAIHRSKRINRRGAVFFLDLDRFKNINDTLGHHVGDDLLFQVAERLRQTAREEDMIARIGGDEFTLVIENLHRPEDAAKVAKNLLKTFSAPFPLKGYELEISASIGISIFPDDGDEISQLTKQADSAMYNAKEQGRNTFRFFTQKLTETAFEFFDLEISLRRALELNQLFLLYQPQYDLISGELIGVEALIRWNHPGMGMVSPNRFIPIAEVSGLIEPIGEWVLQTAATQAIQWDMAGLKPFPVSVNLSRRQLSNPGLVEMVQRILETTGLPGERLELEITESALLETEERACSSLEKLRAMGCSIAIDDFGTGYSSLANLKLFPLDRLKIDKSFVRDVTKDPNDEAIIRATIALGNSLQLSVIAEGVETEAQRDFLLKEGCREVQGFLFSQPVEAKRIEEMKRRLKVKG
ncbi:MAG: EAL domain-containing protein [gamma proteobacterium endosymbiont of Lamellibrachia anaximandri]|nr:EAL domain-containing protein [gamma proteobacterium endosymbiont of Lamellibrachia anaximandri]MBL3534416.1 EAL domain-containing protein [gamma proteobacterium endosymbiont of Lamellibrachia anaximandri]